MATLTKEDRTKLLSALDSIKLLVESNGKAVAEDSSTSASNFGPERNQALNFAWAERFTVADNRRAICRFSCRAWFENAQRVGAQWKASIERAGEIRGLLNQLTLSALDQIGPAMGGIPVLGPALPALTGLAGLFIGSARLRREKEASFNKGLREGNTLTNGNGHNGNGVLNGNGVRT